MATKQKVTKRNRYNTTVTPGTKTQGESLTIPGEVLTIQEIFQRAAVTGDIQAVTDDMFYDTPLDKITHLHRQGLDITDIYQHRQLLTQIESELEAQAAYQAQAERDAKQLANDASNGQAESTPEAS